MRCYMRAWQSLNFHKEYLFGFETLVFAASGILFMLNQLHYRFCLTCPPETLRPHMRTLYFSDFL